MSEEKTKRALDEQMFANLLEAAYVLQEHNRELQAMELHVEPQDLAAQETQSFPAPSVEKNEADPARDYTLTLGQIVETQHQIQVRHLELESAMSLVAERVTEIAHAAGAAIGILEGRKVRYRAVSGLLTLPPGVEVPMEQALCVACLRTGQVIRCADVNSEFLLDIEACQRRGILSMIAVPVYHEGGIAGGLELFYDKTQAFTEKDVHTCQLMAGLVTEALARDEELSWKKSLATERAAMMDALAQLKPQLKSPSKPQSKSKSSGMSKPSRGKVSARISAGEGTSAPTSTCRSCGNEILAEEQFCGECGSARTPIHEPGVASFTPANEAVPANGSSPHRQDSEPAQVPHLKALTTAEKELPGDLETEGLETGVLETGVLETLETPGAEAADASETSKALNPVIAESEAEIRILPEPEQKEKPADAKPVKAQLGAWTSAATTRAILEQLAPAGRSGALVRFWKARRADFYLAIAVFLVACVIRWGLWPNGSVSATGNPSSAAAAAGRKPDPNADLSLFDRMLISLGVAEAPETQENKGGNPDIPVWVDLHTALYYCPGAELYGKGPKGRFTTQREAQLDQFEPASRKACE